MNILLLSTYPTILPRHGGQIRVQHIAHYLRLQGHKVRIVSLCEPTHSQYEINDIKISKNDLAKSPYSSFAYDYATSLLCTQEPYFSRLKSRIIDFNPQVIFIEQSWLYPLYQALYTSLEVNKRPILVYSSHNIEYEAKQELLECLDKADETLISAIRHQEEQLCLNADYVIACTQSDADKLQKMGAKDVSICPNGVDRHLTDLDSMKTLKQKLNGFQFALFVGSAHIPNALGFWNMLSGNLAFLKPNQKIIVAGSVSYILEQYMPKEADMALLINKEKLIILGEVSEILLQCLLKQASAILLPITNGGGSNLKTAEAIVANRHVIATNTAIRGFEFAKQLSNFSVVKTQEEFIKAIQQAFTQKIKTISKDEQKQRDTLYWGITLKPLGELVGRIAVKLGEFALPPVDKMSDSADTQDKK
ncbi:hypothetical protein CCZ01_01055 [Helicobacter monodelphidis]|uniref:glycosyltransferase family 4 protein n=1 Tax=Helicobacter sp. 15-1451 TaxID=2004995 RepID=UPI000DCAF39C|nr:glycosyltransferase family 4 protein [Helicobacter sp. 15-1451]RAX58815.1 hypothetical protein CCZ01_01055 [Helicobacter sp. 15-1451]